MERKASNASWTEFIQVDSDSTCAGVTKSGSGGPSIGVALNGGRKSSML